MPETVVSGETADISPFALLKWHEWVLFRDMSVTYPDDTLVLGRNLCPAMTRKVLKENGQVVYRLMVQRQTSKVDKMKSPIRYKENVFFITKIILFFS